MTAQKIFVVHDANGNIRATVVPHHQHTRIRSTKGTQVHVIPHPGLERKDMPGYLADLHRNHRVEVSEQTRLVRKNKQY
ncbi:MAG: hypothetical protein JOY66_10070 [Acetobacteraceae bacterium]|nr:hypothetical protein [Acetobacteraceae bacterium]